VSKGGFYWHFKDRQALLDEMLDSWEKAVVEDVIASVESQPAEPRAKLQHLFELAPSVDFAVELALRDWSRRDGDVAERLHRIDNRRMGYLRSLFGQFCADENDVEVRSMLVFSLFIGSYVFDGDCAFCTSCARLAEKRIRSEAVIVAWQFADLAELGVTKEQAADAVQWVGVDGAVHSGHEAVAAMLISAGPISRLIGRLLILPGIASVSARAYALVAANRHRLPGGTPACKR
jgi:AcrR family transcriptional regulator